MLLAGNSTLRITGLEEDREGQSSLRQFALPPGVGGRAITFFLKIHNENNPQIPPDVKAHSVYAISSKQVMLLKTAANI